MLTNMMYFNFLSYILLNKLLLNSGGRNSDSAWSKIYDLIQRSLKSYKFRENYQESDFHAGNGRHLEIWPPSLSGILLCINRADSFHQYVFVRFQLR